jgi:outer membrane protein
MIPFGRSFFRLTLAAALAAVASREARAQTAPPTRTLTLGEAVSLAKERAPQVHAAFARVATADAMVSRAQATYLPTLSATGTGTAFYSNGTIYTGGLSSGAQGTGLPSAYSTDDTYLQAQAALNLQWTLYDFGRTSAAVRSAKAGITNATFMARAVEQQAMAEAAVAYYTLLADDDVVQSDKEVLADRERVLGTTHRLAEAGYRTPLDETRAQVAVDVAKLDENVAEAKRDSDGVTLATALMLDPDTRFRLAAPGAVTVDEKRVGNGTAVLEARPDVAAARTRVEQSENDVTSAKRAHLPTLGAQGLVERQYTHDHNVTTVDVGHTSDNPATIAQGSLTLTIPLFDPLVNANVRMAEGSLGEARANLEQTSIQARSEASQAAHEVSNARVVVDQSQRLSAGAKANLTAVENRYENGLDGPLVLADAQREDALARVALVRARLALDVAQVRLLAALSRAGDLAKVR